MRIITAFLLVEMMLFSSLAQAAPCKAPQIKEGVTYTIARKTAVKAGFQIPQLPAYGYSEKDQKVITECSGDIILCNRYPELDSCGSGNCAMNLSNAYGNHLSIFTYGEISDGSAIVTSISIKCLK